MTTKDVVPKMPIMSNKEKEGQKQLIVSPFTKPAAFIKKFKNIDSLVDEFWQTHKSKIKNFYLEKKHDKKKEKKFR